MALSVKFYQRPEHMTFLSDKEGRPIYEPRDYVRIEIPGMVANVVDTLANEDHKRAHPMEWQHYLNTKAAGEVPDYRGTLLSEWPQLNSAQVMEMKHYKFYTVEQVADASDQQIAGIGMLAGMSPLSLRDKAKAWLSKATPDLTAELAKRDEQIAELKAMVEQLAAAKRPKKETTEA
jgi:hypothetical protein